MVIITIAGDPGSGKSTLARQLAAELKIPHFSGGDLFRMLAKELHLSVAQFTKKCEEEPDVWDPKIDGYQAKLPQEHPSFVIDSRLGFHFLPKSIKIYLKVDREEAAMRLMGDAREGESWHTIEEGIEQLKRRRESEQERFKKLYNVNPHDPKHFDLVLDTTHMNAEEKFEKVLKFLNERHASRQKNA